MIYLEFIYVKENVCQYSCKNNHFPGIIAGAKKINYKHL